MGFIVFINLELQYPLVSHFILYFTFLLSVDLHFDRSDGRLHSGPTRHIVYFDADSTPPPSRCSPSSDQGSTIITGGRFFT